MISGAFFQSIATEWKGWKGEKLWSTLENELELEASQPFWRRATAGACRSPPHIAITTVRSAVQTYTEMQEVVFCCFSDNDLAVYERLLQEPAVE